MLILILAVIIGIGLGLFATQNTTLVPLTLANTTFSHIPLYMVALGSLLGGLLLSGIFHLVNGISSTIALSGKNRELQKTEATVHDLQQKVTALENENAKLRSEKPVEKEVVSAPVSEPVEPTVGERIRRFFHSPQHTPSV